ncbi:Fc.00g057750.m01.CDS01 [Cosmosporella sp. VM-42]
MFAEGHASVPLAYTTDKRPASPDLEDAARRCKKNCLQVMEPDAHEEASYNSASDILPSIAQDTCGIGDISWDNIPMALDEGATLGDDAGIMIEQTDSLSSDVVHDTCFGVLSASATSSFFRDQKAITTPVDIQPCGDFVKLYTLDSGKYAGIVTEPALSRLLTEHSVKLTTLLIAPQSSKGKASSTKLSDPQSKPMPLLRVVVYGTMRERSEVGNLLSNAGLYLQHPSHEDIEMDVEYFNPHYLVRPGSQMPRIEDLAISCEDSATTSALDETTKSQLMGIFDTAGDLGIKPTTEPSPRLRHQLTALTVMSEKECFFLESSQCPSLWEASNLCNGEATYRHTITGQTTDDPPLIAGGILADEMGLGKTLSVLSLICWSMDVLHDPKTHTQNPMSLTTLIVTPKSTIPGWQNQIKQRVQSLRSHIIPGQIRVATYHGPGRQRLAPHFRSYDIILTTYQTLRSDCAAKGPLFSEEWFRVVLDEAHQIGNRATQTFRAACELQSPRRWCLTGTPIENTLDNYGALLSFVRVVPFIEKSKFDYWISNSIREMQPDGFPKLRRLVQATCLRRTKRGTARSCKLPSRSEKIQEVDLDPVDRALYEFFKAETARIAAGFSHTKSSIASMELKGRNNILALINFLRLICNHGEDLLPAPAVAAWREKQSGSISWQMMQSTRKSCVCCHCDLESSLTPLANYELYCGYTICATCSLEKEDGAKGMEATCFGRVEGSQMLTVRIPSTVASRPSAKMNALIQNLRDEQVHNQQGSSTRLVKSVVFSYWTKMLDLIHDALNQSGYSCERLDGQSSLQRRSDALYKFANDPTCTVMLATIGSAGEGIDLTSASYVHLMEPHWNPMAEEQAVARVHRIGQLRHVTTTKYITPGSIEEYVQYIQHQKLKLIRNALDSFGSCQREVDDERWKRLSRFLDLKDET